MNPIKATLGYLIALLATAAGCGVYAGQDSAPYASEKMTIAYGTPVLPLEALAVRPQPISGVGIFHAPDEIPTTTTTTTTTTTVAPVQTVTVRCAEWHDLAISVGWSESDWPMLSRVIYKESRCSPDAFNPSDPNGGSRGLTQINGYWCEVNKYNPNGWLQAQGVLSSCDDLYVPGVNLLAALHVYRYSGESWHPWGL